ncbi:tetratricopeptide repeat protein [Roseateles sp. SL47]|jgi:Flp pilus assembly protein TadD|uniref:tetratricopeptide repeat protein n=1 Tax=Roseateles sp. SL47 TaxID=2995138 RepID=UPI0022705424|nr:tetratricopeptide repeat protein [Roseateles sp. SL47]WAC72542.1 tetratricopeptide repeat protein [Roseateles sp. SL47]
MPLQTPTQAHSQARSAASIVSPPSTDGVSRIQPGSHEATLLLAQARNAAFEQASQGRLGEGVNLLCNALEIEPTSVDLLSDVAALLLSAGQLADAALYAHQAVQLQPQHAPSLYTLAFALSGLGEIKAAIEVLTTLCQGEAAEMLKRETPELAPLVAMELRRLQTT